MAEHDAEPSLCDARIKPFPTAVTVMCERMVGHGERHRGRLLDYAYPGSETAIEWMEADRRTFRGDWSECDSPGCILPSSHRGRHAA